MRNIYIHQQPDWPHFQWRQEGLIDKLAEVRHRQGRLLGRMEAIGFDLRQEALLNTLAEDVVTSSEIEGEILDMAQVRFSVARRLGMDTEDLVTLIAALMASLSLCWTQPSTTPSPLPRSAYSVGTPLSFLQAGVV